MSAIVLSDLVYRWPRQSIPCLDIPHFEIAAGERVFLHGPSGAGKSTLLALLGGVALPDAGSVTLLGQKLETLTRRARDRFRADHIGFIFQQFNLLPWLSAFDNVLLPCTFSRRRARQAGNARATAGQLLSHLDLAPESWHRPAAELSVGQQQRVAAARALIGQPEIVLADEPTSALDAPRQQRFIDLLLAETRAAGAALLFVSHDARLAAHFDRVLSLAEINRTAMESNA
ncbi:MAG: ATP-binding cassette domain-containing protein [Rhodocyclaceae bacterium]